MKRKESWVLHPTTKKDTIDESTKCQTSTKVALTTYQILKLKKVTFLLVFTANRIPHSPLSGLKAPQNLSAQASHCPVAGPNTTHCKIFYII